MSIVCPDGGDGCWEPLKDLTEDMDIRAWLRAEMIDGLDHEYSHLVLGPAIFGFDENDIPLFEVYRDPNNQKWCVRAKIGYEPQQLTGIIENPFIKEKHE